ncbi:MAG: chromate transporter [Candidatus Omnitrophica bacterium]|nr:chromate transporter [Candidatus Omnitrophota bacterium]
MIIVKLFLAFFRVGLFAIGGAYSFLPVIEKEVVIKYGWLTNEEFLNLLGFSRVFPGAISIKCATYTGYKMAGIPGAIAANIGNMLTPVILAIFAMGLYTRYKDNPSVKGAFETVQLVVFAMIIAVAFRMIDVNKVMGLRGIIIVVASFALFIYTKIHPAAIIITAGILGALLK